MTNNVNICFLIFTGCDSTSCFKGTGKKKALSMLTRNNTFHGISQLGTESNMSSEVISVCTQFVCGLYEQQTVGPNRLVNINHLRYKLFCQRPTQNERLPPCSDSLIQHLKRANYQCKVWKNSLNPYPTLGSPSDNGWMISDIGLEPLLMTQDGAPKEIKELSSCECKKSKCSNKCSCKSLNMVCTEACLCQADNSLCENSRLDEEIDEHVDEYDSGSEIDSD